MKLEFHPVDHSRWADFERLFESRGAPHYCWCTAWRRVVKRGNKADKTEKKSAIQACVAAGVPIGILAYCDHTPVAWCSIAPRETYRPLGGCKACEKVWSLVCFFVVRSFRGLGITQRLLEKAVEYAGDNGARYVEAYPVTPDSPSYRFMGLVPAFEKAGFKFVKMAGTRRHVMLLALDR